MGSNSKRKGIENKRNQGASDDSEVEDEEHSIVFHVVSGL